MTTKQFQLKIDLELRKKLKMKAVKENKTMNDMIISLIQDFVKEK